MSQPLLSPEPHDDPEKKKILNLYAAMGISMALTIVPNPMVAIVAGIFFVGVLIAAYFIRSKVEIHGLAGNHCTYIIRTIWIGSFFSIITMTVASFFMLPQIDYTPFQVCADTMMSKGDAFLANASNAQIAELSQPCMNDFINANFNILVYAAIIAGGPILIYFLYRFTKGLSRAIKGYRVPDPKAWF